MKGFKNGLPDGAVANVSNFGCKILPLFSAVQRTDWLSRAVFVLHQSGVKDQSALLRNLAQKE